MNDVVEIMGGWTLKVEAVNGIHDCIVGVRDKLNLRGQVVEKGQTMPLTLIGQGLIHTVGGRFGVKYGWFVALQKGMMVCND